MLVLGSIGMARLAQIVDGQVQLFGRPSVHACAYLQLTGRPCASCGLTRGWIAMAHGDVATAREFNPHAPITFVSSGIYMVAGLALAVWKRLRNVPEARVTWLRLTLLGLLVAAWGGVISENIALGTLSLVFTAR